MISTQSPAQSNEALPPRRKAQSPAYSVLLVAILCFGASGAYALEEAKDAHSGLPLFPNHCRVVLLSGVPGDIESENSYREQMEGWLQLVQRSGAVQKLFVLCDHPETLRLPSTVDGTAIRGDRNTLLELAAKLNREKLPLIVIAWGHGGKQRETPVLHVRGPRLTPEDFGQFASAIDAPMSHWILLFRGSGAFGKNLSGENRRIITSESETIFGSDPIGMPLLLKLAGDGKLSFETLAHQFGSAVAQWYVQRNLARTEEPTLWIAKEPAVLLAQDTQAPPAVGGSEDIPLLGETKSVAQQNEAKPDAESKDAEPLRNIRKVSPDKYPEADAVLLSQRSHIVLGSNPALVTEQEQFIQILKPEGKRFGDFDISYSPPHEEVQFLACEVLRPDGILERLDPEGIADASEDESATYQGPHRKVFSLPGVAAGSVIHVRFRTQWKEFPLPRISLELPVGHELPATRSEVQVSVPKSASFHFAFLHVSAPDPEIKSTSYSTSYRWVLENIPAHHNEILTAPRQTPRLMVSTFPDWNAFSQWYQRISRMSDEVTPEIAAKAKELTSKASTDREKLAALYNYVTSLRYVALPLGINSVRPHAADKVLRNQYGDCKDKANLLNAMLRSLNIEANLVLVPRFSQAQASVPGLAFNHAISRVKLGNSTYWLDTTDDICRFGLLPPGDPGRNVLVIEAGNSNLTALPAPTPKDHCLRVKGEVRWADADRGEGAAVQISAVAIGYSDYQLRSGAREPSGAVPLLAVKYRPASGAFALEEQRGTPVAALDQDFSWEARGHWIGLSSQVAGLRILRAPFWVPKEWDAALHQRHAPLYLNQGYPLTLEQDFQIALPPGKVEATLPRLCENSQGPLRWRIEWARLADDKLAARLTAELQKGDLSDAETPIVQDQIRMLIAALAAEASIKLPD